ncbi:DoxX family membrane protein [Halobacteria archaeon AArc-dxtr1]|nr:DoxX family membrane protein [Halobacteria archaeon AArc-dxtr1]
MDRIETERLQAYKRRFDEVDMRITSAMSQWSIPILRVSLAVVFIWFGALKLFEISPAADLVAATVYVVPPEVFVPVLGVWEVVIGICLLYRPLIRVGIFLLFLQLPGTFLPLVLLPEVVYTTAPYALTVEGQYIIKNLVIIGAALAIGSTVRTEAKQ